MHTINLNRMPIILLGSLLLLTLSLGQADEVFGTAKCKRADPGGPCTAAWDFTATGRASSSYWVEKFVYESSTTEWQSVAGPFSGIRNRGKSDKDLEGGFLYRVVGCSDKSTPTNCIGSTVFWAPARPESLDDIPDIIHTPAGYYKRNERLDALDQILDYNGALVSKLVYTVDMSSMPPMTEPAVKDTRTLWDGDKLVHDDAVIEFNMYRAYRDPDLGKNSALRGQNSDQKTQLATPQTEDESTR